MKDQALACKQFWISQLLSITTSKVLVKNCCYSNGRFTTRPPCWPPSSIFFKIFIIILRKTAANFTEISRKHVFAASNRNIIKNRV